ncbi:mavicyanin-like [Curcuma longa]|uniref:mavicyanin-like n=1 Tax=Curcuma longa TaxID=136217 RepID=UPI003D9F12C4
MERKATAVAMALVAWLLAAGVGSSEGAVYKVGDSAGWTIMGSPNYTAWASDKNFQVGDVILFTYNKNFHNVMEVSKTEYSSCNASSTPIATYNSGNDSITIKSKGHHYFFCGIPGHCALGQRVDIKVSGPSSSAAPSISPTASSPLVSPSGSPTSSGASGGISTPASAPKPSSGARLAPEVLAVIVAVFFFATISAPAGLQHY